jgi:V/A-type H+/Na+-transporting ATPase subunit E
MTVAELESVERICDEIRTDGAREVESILGKARGEAAGIVAAAEREAKGIGERIVREAQEKGDLLTKRTLSSVSLEVKRIRLRAREEIVSAVMDAVREGIEASRGKPDYPAVLAGLVCEALAVLEGDEIDVYVDTRDLGLLESAVFPAVRETMKRRGRALARLEGHALPEATVGGVKVGVPGRSVVYDNTFEARMYRFRDDIRAIIFEGIFPGGTKNT